MNTLYESILSSTNSGKTNYIKTLLNTPDRADLLNKEWQSLDLGLDLGVKEGYWRYNKETNIYIYVVTVELKRHDIQTINVALFSLDHEYHSDIIVFFPLKINNKRILTKWAEKISKILRMQISYDKNNIGLNFVK